MEPRNCFHSTKLLGIAHTRTHTDPNRFSPKFAHARTHPHSLTQMIENIEMMLVNNANNICVFSGLRQWIFRVQVFHSGVSFTFTVFSSSHHSIPSLPVHRFLCSFAIILIWLLRKRIFVMTCKAFISTHGIYTGVFVKFQASLIRSMTE